MSCVRANIFVLRLLCCLVVAAVFAGANPAQAQTEPLRSSPPPPAAPSPADVAQKKADEEAVRSFFSRVKNGQLPQAELPQRIVFVRSTMPLAIEYVEPAQLAQMLAHCTFSTLGLRHLRMTMRPVKEDPSAPRTYSGNWKCAWQGRDFQTTATFELANGKVDKLIFSPVEGI